jgi:hypothetical protein
MGKIRNFSADLTRKSALAAEYPIRIERNAHRLVVATARLQGCPTCGLLDLSGRIS